MGSDKSGMEHPVYLQRGDAICGNLAAALDGLGEVHEEAELQLVQLVVLVDVRCLPQL